MSNGRYAPSPTGTLHLGNLRTALAAALIARSSGGSFALRWDDLDDTADPHHEAGQRRDLELLGIAFDPPEMRQTSRFDAYRDALDALRRGGHTYRCWCSRREIREAVAAPHGATIAYPGTCRELTSSQIAEHERGGRPPALRLRAEGAVTSFDDRFHGTITAPVDDVVLQRGDGTPAYNLVVVVDDAAQGVEEVVRGDDLLDSTHRQAFLSRRLGLPDPIWTHVPLVTDEAGNRLAKRDGSTGTDRWFEQGGTPGTLRSAIGRTLGIDVSGEASFADLLEGFETDRIPRSAVVASDDGARLSLPH